MNQPHQAGFRIPLEDSLRFAELSGDWNPLHVDPVEARRTQFGGTVVHGIHALLKSFDVCSAAWLGPGQEPQSISVTFHNPVRSADAVNLEARRESQRMRLKASVGGQPAFSLNVDFSAHSPSFAPASAAHSSRTQPSRLSFPPDDGLQGRIPTAIDATMASVLLPSLAVHDRVPAWVADLVATTRIVGMECPGLDSIYSGLKLQRTQVPDGSSHAMQYRIDRVDPRFRMVRLAVAGSVLAGTVDAFFRPPPVQQLALAEALRAIDGATYAGVRALVVGGSRGVGEVAAKALLAGGADVTVTYVQGAADAQRLLEEAQAAGSSMRIRRLDASKPLSDEDTVWLQSERFTHVLYFASPHIGRNASGRWDQSLYDRLAAIYVDGFKSVMEAVVKNRSAGLPLHVLYPSSVFLDSNEAGFAEYCAAKAAGERLASQLSRSPSITVHAPRLPRMRTDQTSALLSTQMDDPFPVICQALREMQR